MPDQPGRRRATVIAATLTAVLVAALAAPAVSASHPPPNLERFKAALGEVESGGNYYAKNPVSGAYGKYQIMPSNWPSWAEQYLGDRYAKQTPANQEKVVSGKLTDLFHSLGYWKRVAYWWLTGSKKTTGWSTYATNYVNKVMRLYHEGAGTQGSTTTVKRFSETSSLVSYSGSWQSASHHAYAGDKVRYSTQAGATVSITFNGERVVWYGPVGATRGKAWIYVDGKYAKTIDLYSRTFTARKALFSTSWGSSAKHTLTIEVVGTPGRPMVAIDEFIVTP